MRVGRVRGGCFAVHFARVAVVDLLSSSSLFFLIGPERPLRHVLGMGGSTTTGCFIPLKNIYFSALISKVKQFEQFFKDILRNVHS